MLKQIGQLFIIGFDGSIPPDDFLNFIAEEQIGGVILFEDNCATHQQVADNIELIRSQFKRGTTPFIAVDQEGGRVCRLRQAPAEFRAAAEYGAGIGLDRFAEDFYRAATFMESVGINLNLAPVADIRPPSANECLEGRCSGEQPDAVVPFVVRAVEMAKRSGLLSCLKHFPGLGAAVADPHRETPVVDYDELIWRQREMIPFAAGIEHGADMVMTTHLRMEGFGGEIVTGSKRIITTLLRQMLAFDGPVITDDLSMEGAAPLGNIGERAVAAFNAGHDILLICHDHEAAMLAYDFFCDAVNRGDVDRQQLCASLSRVSGIKFKLDSSIVC
jgi:beta-N-acetylhexosaminidase